MRKRGIGDEISFVSHLVTIITMTILSVVLVLLNCILGWEKWMIPVILGGMVLCVAIYIAGRGTERVRIHSYGLFLAFEVFYYTVNISTLSDSTALIVIMIFIFALSGERLLALIGVGSGIAGMVLHLILLGTREGITTEPAMIVRTVWQFVLVGLGAVLADRISAAWLNMEKKYRSRIREIAEENERAGNFLANVSHEIRTPVNAVIGLASIMEKEGIPEEHRGNVAAIEEAGHRVADQIGDIMDYTEIDMKKLSISNERYMINSVVNDLISQLRYMEDYGLDLVVDLSPEVPSELIGDDGKIKKILRHLVVNGFKFTRTGGVNVHVFAKKREYGINLVLEVTDTGVGMTETEIEHVYDKFYQADSGRTRIAGGLGLGIPIVNGMARAMGGFLHIESTPGSGTVVTVSIPQEVADRKPCIAVRDRDSILAVGFLSFMTTSDPRVKDFHMRMIEHLVQGLGVTFRRVKSCEELEHLDGACKITHLFVGTGEYLENKSYIDRLSEKMNVVLVEDKDFHGTAGSRIALMKKPFYGTQVANYLDCADFAETDAASERMTCPGVRVLVVDDEPMNLLVARGIFEAYGMAVSTAANGTEAVECCENASYDIIFMDHMMPGMDGVETMKKLRLDAAKQQKELCIVALTANVSSAAREMFLAEGFDAFLPKPIELMELERVLKSVLPRVAIVYEDAAPRTEAMSASSSAPAEDPYAALREYGVNIETGLAYCQNDASIYSEILDEYARDAETKLRQIADYFRQQDWENYKIRVHAVKSISKTIGADVLSEQALALENAAKAQDEVYIREHHAAFLEAYGELMHLIGPGDSAAQDETEYTPAAENDCEIMEFLPGGSV